MITGSINAHCPSDKSLRYGSLFTPRISAWTCPSSSPDDDQYPDRAITKEQKPDLTPTQMSVKADQAQHRAVATRYDKRRYVYLGTATAAALTIWLRT
ncbi:hypothetical protein [Streptomyces sp. NBC_01296]|uniref:hypothetical protein n=1 Tax=Streptomyces sp. NBC_01296 TaxID=2903816 RepID=UPI002E14D3A0|nr:hypothetical protein OG299_01425 [Streptomyces sp. NBC_01296]